MLQLVLLTQMSLVLFVKVCAWSSLYPIAALLELVLAV